MTERQAPLGHHSLVNAKECDRVFSYTSSFVLFSLLLFEFHFGVCICSDFPSSSTAGYTQECAVSSLQLALLGWGQCADEEKGKEAIAQP